MHRFLYQHLALHAGIQKVYWQMLEKLSAFDMTLLNLTEEHYLDFLNLSSSAYAPLSGFMMESELLSVLEDYELPSGKFFPLPILLDIPRSSVPMIERATSIDLVFRDSHVGTLQPQSLFEIDRAAVTQQLFGTNDSQHPGVQHFRSLHPFFVGGQIQQLDNVETVASKYYLSPSQARQQFAAFGWSTIGAFHTRNIPHKAHEYLHRFILDSCDGLFVHPLLGRKKQGDYTADAIMAGYSTLLQNYYPQNKTMLSGLMTYGRYAGPREALFHALVRRNYGCTHILIGRDHAGVGDYYSKYASQELCENFSRRMDIKILSISNPSYCSTCDHIVTEHTCQHFDTNPDAIHQISGTQIRSFLADGVMPSAHLIRPEVVNAARKHSLFIS